MRMTKPQFFYHVTNKSWKKYQRISPIFSCFGDEPPTARICVAPTLSQCISAVGIPSYESNRRRFIYRTLHKVIAHYPRDVADVRITRERWLRKPTTFIRIGTIPAGVLDDLQSNVRSFSPGGYFGDFDTQREALPEIQKVLQQRLSRKLRTKLVI